MMFTIFTIDITVVRIKYNEVSIENKKWFLVFFFNLFLFIILHIKKVIIGDNKNNIQIISTDSFE